MSRQVDITPEQAAAFERSMRVFLAAMERAFLAFARGFVRGVNEGLAGLPAVAQREMRLRLAMPRLDERGMLQHRRRIEEAQERLRAWGRRRAGV